jgi:non-ribosomal peptide synthetase component F
MSNRFLLHQAVAQAAAQAPEHEAIRCGAESLSYQALFERSNRLARMLRAQGVSRGDRVGIYLNKGLDATVAIYGILAAGAAYVPLDRSRRWLA